MPPNIPGPFNARVLLRAWWLTLFLLAVFCPFLFPSHAEAALTRTFINSYASSVFHGTSGFSTGSFTPPSNSLLVAVIGVMENGGSTDPSGSITITDSAGLTWTSRALVGNSSSFTTGLRIFTAPVTVGTAMTITADAGSLDSAGYNVHVIAYTGYNTSNPIGAIASNSNGAVDGSHTITLSGTPAGTSEILAVLHGDPQGSVTVTPGAGPQATGWSELAESDVTGDGGHQQTQGRTSSTPLLWRDNLGENGAAIRMRSGSRTRT